MNLCQFVRNQYNFQRFSEKRVRFDSANFRARLFALVVSDARFFSEHEKQLKYTKWRTYQCSHLLENIKHEFLDAETRVDDHYFVEKARIRRGTIAMPSPHGVETCGTHGHESTARVHAGGCTRVGFCAGASACVLVDASPWQIFIANARCTKKNLVARFFPPLPFTCGKISRQRRPVQKKMFSEQARYFIISYYTNETVSG